MTTAIADEMRGQTMRSQVRRGDVQAIVVLGRMRGCRTDDPAGRGGGRLIRRGRAQDEAGRVAGCGREREAACGHLVDARPAQLADHHADGAAAQRLLHRPQHVASARGGDHDQPFGREADLMQAGSIGQAVLCERQILGDPDRILSRHDVARRQRQYEAAGGRDLRLACGRNLVQRAAGEPAAKSVVDQRNPKRERGSALAGNTGCRFGRAQRPAQPLDAGSRPFGEGRKSWSYGCHDCIQASATAGAAGDVTSRIVCSCFVLLIPKPDHDVKPNLKSLIQISY